MLPEPYDTSNNPLNPVNVGNLNQTELPALENYRFNSERETPPNDQFRSPIEPQQIFADPDPRNDREIQQDKVIFANKVAPIGIL